MIMGVSGSGKTTVGEALATRLGWVFLDADDFHTPAAKAKMAAGEGLTDADRAPWLARLREALQTQPGGVVLACSALRAAYRDALRAPGVHFAYLRVPRAVLEDRLQHRTHYAGVSLLPSQLDTLEEPAGEADTVTLDVQRSDAPDQLAGRIAGAFALS